MAPNTGWLSEVIRNSATGMDVHMFEERKSQVTRSSANENGDNNDDKKSFKLSKSSNETAEQESPVLRAEKDAHVAPESTSECFHLHEKDEL